MNRRSTILMASGALVVLCVLSCCTLMGVGASMQPDRSAMRALNVYCDGKTTETAPAAKAYVAGQAHRALAFRRSLGSWSLDMHFLPERFRARTLADADVVVCAREPARTEVESCSYAIPGRDRPAFVRRFDYRSEVVAYEARTGREIARDQVSGAPPRACLDDESFYDSQTEMVVNGHYPDDEALAKGIERLLLQDGASLNAPAPITPTPIVPQPITPAPTEPIAPPPPDSPPVLPPPLLPRSN